MMLWNSRGLKFAVTSLCNVRSSLSWTSHLLESAPSRLSISMFGYLTHLDLYRRFLLWTVWRFYRTLMYRFKCGSDLLLQFLSTYRPTWLFNRPVFYLALWFVYKRILKSVRTSCCADKTIELARLLISVILGYVDNGSLRETEIIAQYDALTDAKCQFHVKFKL